jgi:hypothetical protein
LTITRPLHNLTKKDAKWEWTKECNSAFNQLKDSLTAGPVLVQPNHEQQYELETDASNFAMGAVLSQRNDKGELHPVAFLSKSFSDPQRNYSIHDKELLAIIMALEEWRHLLEGARHKVLILTDHQNLLYFSQAHNLNRRQARWALYLSRFNFELVHRPGRLSGKPDALSRRADHDRGMDDNKDEVLLPPNLFKVNATPVLVSTGDERLLDRIRGVKDREERVVKAFKELGSSKGTLRGEEWEECNGLVFYNGRVYVPNDPQIRHDILQQHHDTPIHGHPGKHKTYELVNRNFWWPSLGNYVTRYVQGCDACNRTKNFPAPPAGKLHPNKTPTRRWQVVTVDLIVGLPPSQGYDSIFVSVDRLSKRVHVAPTNATLSALGTARLFRDHVWRHHGLPEEVISDRGPQFVSNFMRELNRLLGIQTRPSTAFHPQTDGQTERVNQELEQYLRLYVNTRQDDWAEWLASF